MAFNCDECNSVINPCCINNLFKPRVCKRYVSKSISKNFKSLTKQLDNEDNQRKRTFLSLRAWIQKQPTNKEITTTEIIRVLGIYGATDGDFIRIILDNFICRGMLIKKRFCKGKGGHIWMKGNIDRCKEYNEKCDFNFIYGKKIEKVIRIIEENEE